MDSGLQARMKDVVAEDPDLIFGGIDLTNPEAEEPPYDWISDRKALKALMEQVNEDYNNTNKKNPMSLGMFNCFSITIDKQYKHPQFRDDLKKLYEKAGT